jgi:hypothetical protein
VYFFFVLSLLQQFLQLGLHVFLKVLLDLFDFLLLLYRCLLVNLLDIAILVDALADLLPDRVILILNCLFLLAFLVDLVCNFIHLTLELRSQLNSFLLVLLKHLFVFEVQIVVLCEQGLTEHFKLPCLL